jgi:hypothetical protein
MPDPAQALATQLANIEKRTGRSLDALVALVANSGLAKHGEKVAMLKQELGMGHGDANTLVHYAMKTGGTAEAAPAGDAVLDEIYAGPKAGLRPIHEAVMARLAAFGDFEIAPKKGYLSLRRKKQFAMIGPGTNGRVDVGLNMKGVTGTDRLKALPAGGMCQYQVRLTAAAEVDDDLMAWLRTAYDSAG